MTEGWSFLQTRRKKVSLTSQCLLPPNTCRPWPKWWAEAPGLSSHRRGCVLTIVNRWRDDSPSHPTSANLAILATPYSCIVFGLALELFLWLREHSAGLVVQEMCIPVPFSLLAQECVALLFSNRDNTGTIRSFVVNCKVGELGVPQGQHVAASPW